MLNDTAAEVVQGSSSQQVLAVLTLKPLPLVVAACVAIATIVTALLSFPRKSKLDIPILLADEVPSRKERILEYGRRPRQLMWEGYTKYPGKVFGLDTHDGRCFRRLGVTYSTNAMRIQGVKAVLPVQFVTALKSHPHLSFKVSIDNDMLLDYTLFGGPPEFVINAIRTNLTPTLPQYIPVLHKLIKERQGPIMGHFEEWTPDVIHDRVLKVAATASARVFHSTAASHNEEWLEVAVGYVTAVFECIKALKKWPPYLRSSVNLFLPERRAIKKQWSIGRSIVTESLAQKTAAGGLPIDNPPTMLDHLTSGKQEGIANDIDKQLRYQMTLVAVGTVTTFGTTVQVLYDLAGRPEYVQILRDEVIEVVRNAPDGILDKDSISALKKMDSFMKESQRLSSPDLTTFQRAATADITLPDGTVIPKGTKLETNTCSIHADPANYDNPTSFDGLRFYRKRQEPGEENKHLFVSVGSEDLAFGFGRHACPGRFMSHIAIKLFLVEFLLHYDIKGMPGVGRPKNLEFEAMVEPDPHAQVLIKSIKSPL